MTMVSDAAPQPTHVGQVPWRRMIWVTWRLDRATLLGVLALLGGLALALAITGSVLQASWIRLGLDKCGMPPTSHGDSCYLALAQFANTPPANAAFYVIDGLHLVPVLIGMFAGAPLLARELESGTFRFTWTQGIGRTRWLAAKLLLLAAPLTIGAYALGQLFSWWYGLVDWYHNDRWGAGPFDLGGITFAAWTPLAFAVGAFAGVAIRQTVKAMAATAVVVACLAVLVPLLIRPLLIDQTAVTAPTSYPSIGARGDLILDHWLTGPDGHRLAGEASYAVTDQANNVPFGGADSWLAQHHYAYWIRYEPASHFWILQSAEALGLAVLALLFGAATVIWVRRRAA